MKDAARRVNRRFGFAAYLLLYGLTFLGITQAEPRVWGVPVWFLWAGLIILLLVPLNLWFVCKAWPHAPEDEPHG